MSACGGEGQKFLGCGGGGIFQGEKGGAKFFQCADHSNKVFYK